MKYDIHKNKDGTYTSPHNARVYKNLRSFVSHMSGSWGDVNQTKYRCRYCFHATTIGNITNHERLCFLNPTNLMRCVVCSKPVKNYKTSKGTCSRSCSNKHFRTGLNNGNFQGNRYQTLCFAYHDKSCVVCGETNIVAVHHNDGNHSNNDPSNLIPMCPTHHAYVHSRFRELVQPTIDEYITKWKNASSIRHLKN